LSCAAVVNAADVGTGDELSDGDSEGFIDSVGEGDVVGFSSSKAVTVTSSIAMSP